MFKVDFNVEEIKNLGKGDKTNQNDAYFVSGKVSFRFPKFENLEKAKVVN